MVTAAVETLADDIPVSARLKQATRAVHDQLHRTPLLAAFERAELDIDDYLRVLQVFHDFYAAIDQPIEDAMPLLPALPEPFEYVPRAPMFARDLASLGVRSLQTGMSQPPQFSIASTGSLAGALYVVEGSILGGAGLNQCARKILQGDDLAGRFYWQWCRDNAAARWPSVRRALNAAWREGCSEAEMIATAGSVFDDLLQRFEQAAGRRNLLTGAST
jgi:heme oxygenase